MKAARIKPQSDTESAADFWYNRINTAAKAENGVKKLRELILELAVRGKLVPQQLNDEPATTLLMRIAEKKAALAKKGLAKQEKPQTAIADNEALFDLPPGWKWCRFTDVCSYIQRGKGPDYVEKSDYPVISQKCVRWYGLDISKARFINKSSLSKYDELRFLLAGDILWNSTGTGTIGRASVMPEVQEYKKIVADSHVTVMRPIIINPAYLWRWIQSPSVQSKIEGVASGTTNQIELPTSTVISHLLPLPPLPEQDRIVAKVDELMALCDRLEAQEADAAAAHETLVKALLGTLTQSQTAKEFQENWQRIAKNFDTLFTSESSIDTLKQTILQLAVIGKLVLPISKDGSATELLMKIETQKKQSNKGRVANREEAVKIDTHRHIIPPHWAWVQLGNITEIGTGSTPSRTQPLFWNDGSIPWITSGSTSKNIIKEGDEFVTKEAVKAHRLKLYQSGTLLVALYGQGKTRGQVTTLGIEATINQACAAICALPGLEAMQPYIKLLLLKNYDEIRLMSAGGAQPNLNLQKIKEIWVPLPPLAEQQRIVSKVDELMALCDDLNDRLVKAHTLHEHLATALVEKAIGGSEIGNG